MNHMALALRVPDNIWWHPKLPCLVKHPRAGPGSITPRGIELREMLTSGVDHGRFVGLHNCFEKGVVWTFELNSIPHPLRYPRQGQQRWPYKAARDARAPLLESGLVLLDDYDHLADVRCTKLRQLCNLDGFICFDQCSRLCDFLLRVRASVCCDDEAGVTGTKFSERNECGLRPSRREPLALPLKGRGPFGFVHFEVDD